MKSFKKEILEAAAAGNLGVKISITKDKFVMVSGLSKKPIVLAGTEWQRLGSVIKQVETFVSKNSSSLKMV